MAQQNPATKLVAYIVVTFLARKVMIHEIENGIAVTSSTFRRPNRIATPMKRAPNSAPRSDKLAIHEASCSLTENVFTLGLAWTAVKFDEEDVLSVCGNDEDEDCNDKKEDEDEEVVDEPGNRSCKEAIAGELYPLLRPTVKGPSDTARVAKICKK